MWEPGPGDAEVDEEAAAAEEDSIPLLSYSFAKRVSGTLQVQGRGEEVEDEDEEEVFSPLAVQIYGCGNWDWDDRIGGGCRAQIVLG